MKAANKQFKKATAKLRKTIVQKSDIQSKVDKVKEPYSGSSKKLIRRSRRCKNLSRASRQRCKRQ